MFGVGSVFFGANTPKSGSGTVTSVAANEGLSIDPASTAAAPRVQLGDAVNGLSAAIVGDRYIDVANGTLWFLNVGDPVNLRTALNFRESAGRVFGSEPFQRFFSSAGAEIGRINFGDSGGVYIGANAAVNETRSGEIAIGKQVFQLYPTGGSNIGIGAGVMGSSPNVRSNNIGIGNNSMAGLTFGGNLSVGIGLNTLFNATGNLNTAIGAAAGGGVGGGDNCVYVGGGAGYQNAGLNLGTSNNTFVGALIQNTPNTGWDANNTIVGALNVQSVQLGANNIMLGYNNQFTNTSNSAVIGNNFNSVLNNIFFLANPDQNVVVGGALVGQADSGVKMQVIGALSTTDPDTGLSGSGWELGTYRAGAVVLDGAHYVSVKIGGVAYKLLVAA